MPSSEFWSQPIHFRLRPSVLVVGLMGFVLGYVAGEYGKTRAEAERWQAVRDVQQCRVRAERAEARNTELKQQNQLLMESQERLLRTIERTGSPEDAAVDAALAALELPP